MNSIASSNFNFHRSSCVIILHITKRQHHQANHCPSTSRAPRAVARNGNLPFGKWEHASREMGPGSYSAPAQRGCPTGRATTLSFCPHIRRTDSHAYTSHTNLAISQTTLLFPALVLPHSSAFEYGGASSTHYAPQYCILKVSACWCSKTPQAHYIWSTNVHLATFRFAIRCNNP